MTEASMFICPFAQHSYLRLSLSNMFRFIPKSFESSELKKVRLQEKMSGLKHQFSIENEPNLHGISSPSKNDDTEIDPVDECKYVKEHPSYVN